MFLMTKRKQSLSDFPLVVYPVLRRIWPDRYHPFPLDLTRDLFALTRDLFAAAIFPGDIIVSARGRCAYGPSWTLTARFSLVSQHIPGYGFSLHGAED